MGEALRRSLRCAVWYEVAGQLEGGLNGASVGRAGQEGRRLETEQGGAWL